MRFGGLAVSGISAYETEMDFWPIVAIEGAQMGQKSGPAKEPAEQVIREIRRSTRRQARSTAVADEVIE